MPGLQFAATYSNFIISIIPTFDISTVSRYYEQKNKLGEMNWYQFGNSLVPYVRKVGPVFDIAVIP